MNDNDNKENCESINNNNPFDEQNAGVERENSDNDTPDEAENNDNTNEADKLKTELAELNNRYIRLAADFDNYRKRQASEREDLLKYGCGEVLTKLITVLDSFTLADNALKDTEDIEKVKESFNVILKQLTDTLKKCGLEKIDAVGQKFDPNLHEAVLRTKTDEHEDGTVISEMRTGYSLYDRVLRPAMVNVAVSKEQN